MDKVCFVVCPIGENNSDTRKNSDELLEYILKPVCAECGFNCVRVDEINDNDIITETIISYLNSSDLVIADLSEHNPNAFYEIGYRSALKKPIIHIKNETDKIPFDVYGIRTISYNLHELPKVEETKRRLKTTIGGLKFDNTDSKGKENSDYNKLLSEMFKIQDELQEIKSSLVTNDTSAISVLADKLKTTSVTPEVAIIQSLFSLFSNPEAVKTIMSYSNKNQSDSLTSENNESNNS